MKFWNKRQWVSATVITILMMTAIVAHAALVPNELQAKLFLRILAYDRAITGRAGAALTIGVIHSGGGESKSYADGIVSTLSSYSSKTVKGLPFKVVPVQFSGQGDLAAAIASQKLSVLYVPPGLSGSMAAIKGAAQATQTRTLTAVSDYIGKGVSVGVVLDGGKPKIVVHLATAKSEGADYDSQLLSISEVVR